MSKPSTVPTAVELQATQNTAFESIPEEEPLENELSNVPIASTTLITGVVSCTLNVKALGKPRMTRRDQWAPRETVQRYYSYCDELRAGFNRAVKFQKATTLTLTVRFAVKYGASGNSAKDYWGKPHWGYPDLDNIIKGVLDALLIEDKTIHTIVAHKFWDKEDLMVIKLEGVE